MIPHRVNQMPTTVADDPTCVPMCFGESTLLLTDTTANNAAWIAMEDALDVRDYR